MKTGGGFDLGSGHRTLPPTRPAGGARGGAGRRAWEPLVGDGQVGPVRDDLGKHGIDRVPQLRVLGREGEPVLLVSVYALEARQAGEILGGRAHEWLIGGRRR